MKRNIKCDIIKSIIPLVLNQTTSLNYEKFTVKIEYVMWLVFITDMTDKCNPIFS